MPRAGGGDARRERGQILHWVLTMSQIDQLRGAGQATRKRAIEQQAITEEETRTERSAIPSSLREVALRRRDDSAVSAAMYIQKQNGERRMKTSFTVGVACWARGEYSTAETGEINSRSV